jgi:hypothetical protein
MLKKALVIVLAVVVFGAVAVPNASAQWLANHATLTTNAIETFTGTVQYQGLVGKTHCANIEVKVQFTSGSTTATLQQFKSPDTSKCHVSGALGTSCGTNSLQNVELQGQATIHVFGKNTLTVTSLKLLYVFGACAQTLLESDATRDVTLTPISPETIGTSQVSGTLKTAAGNVAVSGTLQAHNQGTYGFKG